jgi:hypothetical protein
MAGKKGEGGGEAADGTEQINATIKTRQRIMMRVSSFLEYSVYCVVQVRNITLLLIGNTS